MFGQIYVISLCSGQFHNICMFGVIFVILLRPGFFFVIRLCQGHFCNMFLSRYIFKYFLPGHSFCSIHSYLGSFFIEKFKVMTRSLQPWGHLPISQLVGPEHMGAGWRQPRPPYLPVSRARALARGAGWRPPNTPFLPVSWAKALGGRRSGADSQTGKSF